ncbi:DUF4079 domain-containing protein [Roseofilum casamattae]|uniref:DUF4079 domain-containing protein n=1 Tax=Roseofilum casamattae BLCC-M143 TaxID=3022442 RepID=A0ABT7C1N4_9CYAN|nr:DUF4079 domain-containing protein [Roseofilum casamattae]MDJ1185354.1 DUF4079 domain-containing protein [Roseofilum casamattae BLCC-M143]
MHLPSFLWLWRIAAWSMGFAVCFYCLLAITGTLLWWMRQNRQPQQTQLRSLHYVLGGTLVFLVLLLLAIGVIGTLGHYGSLGHSSHLAAGFAVVALVAISAWSATQISSQRPWARPIHLTTNTILFIGFIWVSWTGWSVVQKYLN